MVFGNTGSAAAVDGAVVGDNAAHSAYQYQLLRRDLLRQESPTPASRCRGRLF